MQPLVHMGNMISHTPILKKNNRFLHWNKSKTKRITTPFMFLDGMKNHGNLRTNKQNRLQDQKNVFVILTYQLAIQGLN